MSNYSDNHVLEDPNTPWYKIINFVIPGSRILDIGCSSGNLGSELIAKKNCEVVGLDLSAQDVKLAKKRLSDAQVRNAENEDLSDLGTFDYIIFADVIEHLMDPVATLRKIQSSLKPGGSVIFSIPNMANMATRLMVLDGVIQYGETGLLDKTHLHYYDKAEVQRIFKEAGYDLEEFDWVERYMSEAQLKTRLKHMGLTPDANFLERAKQVEATAYEYVGRSTPTMNNKPHIANLPFVSPSVASIDEQVAELTALHKQELREVELASAIKVRNAESELHGVFGSLSWRITLPLRLVNGIAWRIRQKIRVFIYGVRKNSRLRISERPELKYAEQAYATIASDLSGHKRSKDAELAVIVHVFYPDLWPVISSKLKILGKTSYDLYVTLAGTGPDAHDAIKREYPHSFVTTVPNRGRDVLPFVAVASTLKAKGYKSILKIHSKKSLHREDGNDWFTQILSTLLPDSKATLDNVLDKLTDKKTGIIGPEGQYVSLEVNYGANAFFIMKLVRRIYSKQKYRELNGDRGAYGFFAGTMFWARLDAIDDLLSRVEVSDFEKEAGQIDTTIAHSIERLLCLVAEFENKDMYEVGVAGVKQIAYTTNNIPEWSELYIDLDKK